MKQPPDHSLSRAPSLPASTPADQQRTTPFFHGQATEAGEGRREGSAREWWPVIPGYEIEAVLGRGGMGIVYRARHLALKRDVALKMIRAGSAAGTADLVRFRTEAEAVARLQHPNIVQIHEVGTVSGLPFCALEFVDGGSLAHRLADTPLTWQEAAAVVEQLARAMQVAHSRHVIHRDLKPANVLLLRDGTPKVTDFGLARRLDADSGETQAGDVVGTPCYMAPEQAAGQAHAVGPACDVYALGGILYECLTGRPPFRGASALETLEQVRSQEPVAPQLLRPKVPRDLATICLKCLRKEPAGRYASAEALADDLRRFLDGRPILARPTPSWERLLRWARREPVSALLAASVLLVTLLGFVLVLWQWQRAEDRRVVAEQAQLELEQSQKITEGERVTSQRLAIRMALDRGLGLCGKGEVGHGLLWLARGLQLTAPLAPDSRADLEWVLRTNLAQWRYEVASPLAVRRITSDATFPSGARSISSDGRHALLHSSSLRRAQLWDLQALEPVGPGLEMPGGLMTSFAFSPEGEVLATSTTLDGEAKGEIRLWSTSSGRQIAAPFRYPSGGGEIVVGPGGRAIVCIEPDGTASLHALDPSGPPHKLYHPGESIRRVAFSGDGKRVLTAGSSRLRLWDGATGQPCGQMGISDCIEAGFSPDSAAVFLRQQQQVQLYSTANLQPIGQPMRHDDLINAAVFSRDSKLVLTGSVDTTARLWWAATGLPAGPALRHEGIVSAVALAPDGRTAATIMEGSSIQLWSATDGQRIGSALTLLSPLVVTFSPDSKTLVSCGQGLLRHWPVRPAPPPGATLTHSHKVLQLAFGPDGRTFVTATWGRAAHLLSLTPCDGDRCAILTPRAPPLLHGGAVHCLAFSQDGQALFTGGDREAHAWSAATGRPLGPPLKLAGAGNLIRFFPDADGQTVWTVDTPGRGPSAVQRWTVATGKPLGAAIHFEGPGRAVARSLDGRLFLTGHRSGGGAQLWDAASRQPLGPPLNPDERTFLPGVAFHPDGKVVATGGYRTVRLWNVADGRPVGPALSNPNNANGVKFSPDGQVLLVEGNHEVRLWSAETGLPIGTPLHDSGGLILYRDFSPDSKLVLTSGAHSGQLWSTATGHPIGPPLRHNGLVRTGAFSPDGKLLATGGEDYTVRLWRAPEPVEGSPEQVLLWAEVLTGMALDGHNQLLVQDGDAWLARRRALDGQEDLPAVLRQQCRIMHE